MKAFILSSLLFLAGVSFAGYEYENFKLSDDVKVKTLSKEDLEHNAVYIFDRNYHEFANSTSFKGQKLSSEIMFNYHTYHRRIRLNNDKAVEEFNKMYIRVSAETDLLSLKARSINPDGTVTNFNEDNIKYIEDFEGHGPFKIFAFEGVQVGAEIEYLYTMQEFDGDFYGHIYVQNEYPKKEYTYELIFPSRLIFDTKSYNAAPKMVLDTLNEDKHKLSIKPCKIEFFEEEESSALDANKQRIEYVLIKNTATGKENFYNWNKAQTAFTENMYNYASNPKLAKKEQKALLKLIKLMGLETISNEKEKVYAMEQYLKTKINIGTDYGTTLVDEIIKNNNASPYGATRLYVLILTHLAIPHELVLTTNRFDKAFDGEFETFNFLNKFLVYFPQYNSFTDPSKDNARFGVVSHEHAYQKGLFLKMKEIGGVKAFFSEVKEITGLPYELTYSNLTADVKLNDEFNAALIHLKNESLGYHDLYPRPYLSFLNAEKKDEALRNELKIVKDGTEVLDYTTKNEEMKGYMLTVPFVVEGNVKIESLVEKAGNNYLVKVGLVIGPQMEMYKTKARKAPAELYYKHSYHRVINFTIPDGYTVSNLNELKMDVSFLNKGTRTMEFTSNYELKGNVLTIRVNEFYDEISVPVSRFEEYRAVINAAADFNKKILVLKKK